MTAVPLSHVLWLSTILFCLGLVGLIARRNLIFMLVAVEIMLNAAALAFIGAGSSHGDPDAQAMFLFILAVSAAEVSVGLAMVLKLEQHLRTLDADAANLLRD